MLTWMRNIMEMKDMRGKRETLSEINQLLAEKRVEVRVFVEELHEKQKKMKALRSEEGNVAGENKDHELGVKEELDRTDF